MDGLSVNQSRAAIYELMKYTVDTAFLNTSKFGYISGKYECRERRTKANSVQGLCALLPVYSENET
jgi:hypothetical protein